METFRISVVQIDEYLKELDIEAETLEEAETKALELSNYDMSMENHTFNGSEKHIYKYG